MDRGAVAVGDHDAAIVGQDMGWEAFRDGKIKPVAIGQIIRPFGVAPEIGDRAFDLDDDKLAAAPNPMTSARRRLGRRNSVIGPKPVSVSRRQTPRVSPRVSGLELSKRPFRSAVMADNGMWSGSMGPIPS